MVELRRLVTLAWCSGFEQGSDKYSVLTVCPGSVAQLLMKSRMDNGIKIRLKAKKTPVQSTFHVSPPQCSRDAPEQYTLDMVFLFIPSHETGVCGTNV